MLKAKPRTLLTSLYLSAAALVFLPATLATAEETEAPAKTVMEDCAVPMKESSFQSGLRVWIDPATGKIRQPTEAERKATAERVSVTELLNRSHEGLVVEQRRDGSKFVNLQGRFMHALVLTRAEDGTLVAHCVDDEHQVNKTAKVAAEEPPVR